MLPIWSLGNGRLIVSMDISMRLPLLPSLRPSLSLSRPPTLPLPAVAATAATPPASRLPHVRSCMFFCFSLRKTFSLLPFKADTFAHFAHRAAARPHTSCPHSAPPLQLVPWPEQLAFVHGLAATPTTHLARKRRARINLLNFAAFAAASACGMY